MNTAKRRIVRTVRTYWVAPEGIAIDSRRDRRSDRRITPGTPDGVVLLKESTGAQVGRHFVGFYPNLLTVDPGTGNVYIPIVFKNVVTQFHL